MLRSERDGCNELVALIHDAASTAQTFRQFFKDIGLRGAGIRPGWRGLMDLAKGGTNILRGKGFKPRFDDGTSGQVRHFCGVVATANAVGANTARFLLVYIAKDSLESADGQLSEAAIDFVQVIKSQQLRMDEAPRWISENLCT